MRILDFKFHIGYQYELSKLGHKFDLAFSSVYGEWDSRMRPLPGNVSCIDEFDIKKYDLAIAHNNKQFQLLKRYDIPKVIIVHSTFRGGENDLNLKKEDLSNCYVVFNSIRDSEIWDLKNVPQKVIWHGFDPSEWKINEGIINKVLVVGRYIKPRSNITGYNLLKKVLKDIDYTVVGNNPEFNTKTAESFDQLKNYYRDYAVFFNSSVESPMPRARAEAMMSAMPIVTTDLYDTERFIEDGVNGFKSNNAELLKEYLLLLLFDVNRRKELGNNARETAIKYFHIHRFLSEWREVIETLLDKRREIFVQNESSVKLKLPLDVVVTRKVFSGGYGGGGSVTVRNVVDGLLKRNINAVFVDVDSKKEVSLVNGALVDRVHRLSFTSFVEMCKPKIIIYDDIVRLKYCEESLKFKDIKKYLLLCGTPSVHADYYSEGAFVKLPPGIERCFVRDARFARYLKMFHGDRIIIWIGGCDGVTMREKYGFARYKNPKLGTFISTLSRKLWCKNHTSCVLVAYAIWGKYPNTVYFKVCLDDVDEQFILKSGFNIQTEGDAKGVSQERAYSIMQNSQLGVELAYSDAFPRVVNEYMNFGVPVLVSSAIDHVYKNKLLSKYLIVRNPNDMFEAYKKALVLLENKDIWEAVSKECINFSSQYNTEQEASVLIENLALD